MAGSSPCFVYKSGNDYMYFRGVRIYYKGKWAEILEEQPIPSTHPLIDAEERLLKTFDKPKQYQIGIDTFQRMEANCSVKERIAFVKGSIDAYLWREKDQDIEDFEKIIAYAKWALKQLKD